MSQHPAWNDEILRQVGLLLADLCVTHGKDRATEVAKTFLELFERCESPIETPIAGLLAAQFTYRKGKVTAQAQLGKYRVDFLIESPKFEGPGIIIECDGHDFHERTPQQAARDRKRDRDLQRDGYLVLRFTGSEIHSSFQNVAAEIIAAVAGKRRKADVNV